MRESLTAMDVARLEEQQIITTKEARQLLGLDTEPRVDRMFTQPTEVHVHMTFPKGLSQAEAEKLRDAFMEKHGRR